MKGNFKATEALTLLSANTLEAPTKGAVEQWQKVVAGQLNEIARAERMTPAGRWPWG